ncbi:MAG: double-strand break repair helicase AddA [Alphaproteobacteria bacterium]|nr:double-strand break repair helicase AddA [Alphaproteobacteria bacterium]
MSDAASEAYAQQRRAIRPDRSTWVMANAGTGKTHVLTDRILRLLLTGAEPGSILCLTFTRAAAAEMRNRLAGRLGRWTLLSDRELSAELVKLDLADASEAMLRQARQLFARVLDAPGGVHILTIHAFAQWLLARFPLEAGVAPGAKVLDETEAGQLLDQARDEQINAISGPEDSALKAALKTVARRVSEMEYAQAMDSLLRERSRLPTPDEVDAEIAALRQGLNLADSDDEDTVLAATWRATGTAMLGRLAKSLAKAPGAKNDAMVEGIKQWLGRGRSDAEARRRWPEYRAAFLTAKDEPRKDAPTKKWRDANPALLREVEDEAARLIAAEEKRRAAVLTDMSGALLRLAVDMASRYTAAKRARATLDYDDLILRVKQLLSDDGVAAWVLYKLDGGIDHVLVDEAQDTNPDQWDIVRALTGEFFSGKGAVDRPRTVFAVGDAKQSIFSFQRADPRKLEEMREHFGTRAKQVKHRFEKVGLTASFRSTEAVLAAVDAVFATGRPANDGVGDGSDISHRAMRAGEPGLVELWPICKPDGDDDSADSSQRMARLVAAHCASLIGKERLADGRLVDAGDIMVLLRKRNAFVGELIGELKTRDIDVAGRDRFSLFEDLGVQDLVALGKAALLPTDDLNLACVLKGPLIGISEADLFKLAYKRTGDLWSALRALAGAGEAGFATAYARLSTIFARVDFLSPHAFYARILGPEGGRRALLERLGPDALDPIDEFLAQALSWSTAGHGSLQGFLHAIETEGGEVKRDLDGLRRREVRILTVHASKGLQAPIVYLPDTCSGTNDRERVLWVPNGPPLWAFRTAETKVPAIDTLKLEMTTRQREEHHRLLYVAMTRAGERLYVGGFHGKKAPRAGHWHGLIDSGLRGIAEGFDFAAASIGEGSSSVTWPGEGLRVVRGKAGRARKPASTARARQPLPDWAQGAAPAEPVPPRPLMPSRPDDEEALGDAARAAQGGWTEPASLSPLADDRDRRFRRGTLLHRLLQRVPDVAPSARAAFAARWLEREAGDLDRVIREQWATEAMATLDLPEATALFAPGTRAEVPVVGTVDTPSGRVAISGQIDRLAVTAEAVLFADIKTNRPPPRRVEDVPRVYRRQLALYRALLAGIYADRPVRGFLLWTDGPRLMEVPAALLDAALMPA